MEIKLYQSLVGTAMYIMLLTRVDISFTVQWLSRSLNRPTKSHLNAAKNLFKYLNSTKDYSICFSYNGNTVADLGPKLSNSSNTTTKLSRDFHSKEGPRPLTTTSTTIVDSRNSKGSSRTSIINSSLVPIDFSDSDFAGDKATSKSTYGYLYKLASGPISWKTKRATTIALSTLEAETDGLTEAIREVQWIIGLFSELHRPIDYPITLYRDNQGSITVANDPALYARTKYTLLKFQYVREQVKAKIVTIIYLNTKCTAVAIPAKAANTAAAKPAKPANTAAVPATTAKAAAAKPAGATAAAIINDIGNTVPPIISTSSAYIALYAKAKAKAKKEEEEEEEKEEEKEDKEVVEEEKDIGGRGKKNEGSYTCFKLLLPHLTISIVATSRIPSKGNS
ncbi:hypothetical protein P8C59_008807 [Phyllachora maydis]|uniref:Uncharacterized protein n=1 Tax=Phyllachora maydis TaxID=1825666 RepID=A0AAD9MIW1_9PEZI|nr:hypothetical protein P8C59_008807 [Phyllachora maydis]